MYLVSSQPVKGSLLYLSPEGRYLPTTNFSQAAIDEGRVFYEHQAELTHVKDFDHFKYEAVADYAPYRLKGVFNILISLSTGRPGGIDRFIKMKPIVCPEGGNVTLFAANLNTTGIIDFIRSNRRLQISNNLLPIRLKVTSVPLQGSLSLRDRLAKPGDTFSQLDINAGRVVYRHDHSDTTTDRIGFSVYLLGDMSGANDLLLYSSNLNVSITPVNDRMPFLATKNPGLVVVRGQHKTVNRDMLEVQDPDTRPENIMFTVLDNGLQGRLVLAGDNDNQRRRAITHFSQADINAGRVVYEHDGASTQTQFYFSVTDGRFQPLETGLSRHFRIHVIPLTLELRNNSVIRLEQGTVSAIVTNANMGAASNGDTARIEYTIVKGPLAGQLMVEDRPATTFSQELISIFYAHHLKNSLPSLCNKSLTHTFQKFTTPLHAHTFPPFYVTSTD